MTTIRGKCFSFSRPSIAASTRKSSCLRSTGNCDQLELARMKKRKLALKDEIQVLTDRIVPDIIA